jgi:hypothetical protein
MANVNKTGGQPRVQQTQDQQKIQNTKKQIGQITHTILQLVPNDSSTKTKITRIAQELYDYAASNEYQHRRRTEGNPSHRKRILPLFMQYHQAGLQSGKVHSLALAQYV